MHHPSHPKSGGKLTSLPQKSSTWHVAVRKLGFKTPVEGGGEVYPHIVVVVDLTLELFLAMEPFEKRPTAEQVQAVVFKAMQQPADGKKIKPYRPMRVEFEQPDMLHDLSPALWEIEVASSSGHAAAIIDEVVEGLNQALGGQPVELPGLLSIPGMTVKTAERLFEAAASFYRAAPWETLSDRDSLRVKFGDMDEERIVQIMGSGGIELGITLYEDWEDVLRIYQNSGDPVEGIPADGLHGLTFTSKEGLPSEDQVAIKRYRWKVANRSAYPLPLIYTPLAPFRPDLQEIIFYEALMRALPKLVEEHFKPQMDAFEPFEAVIEVTTTNGPMRLEFTYPAGELPEELVEWEIGEDDEDDWDDEFTQMELTPEQERAAVLVDQAWEEEDDEQRHKLAQQALQIAPDYPETYLVLAETADTPEEAIDWYQKGIAAGNVMFPLEWLTEQGFELWNVKEGLPVLYLHHGLADTLRSLGRYDEALDQYGQLLDLDPYTDEEGARFEIISLLLRLKRDKEATQFLNDYGDMLDIYEPYGRALLEFRQNGNSQAARQALKKGMKANNRVVPLLTGERPLPENVEELEDIRDRQAAILASDLYPGWWGTPGAIDWLKKHAR